MKYIPFLKLKNNEVSALKELSSELLANVTPLFDIPRIKDMNAADFISRIRIALKSLNSNWDKNKGFYVDVFDITPGLKPAGKDIYGYTLDKFKAFNVIPVVGLDRDEDHLNSVVSFLKKSPKKNRIAIRLLPADFINFDAVSDEIGELLGEIIKLSKSVDLILDARILSSVDVELVAINAAIFATKFEKMCKFRRVVISGSSIPSSVSEIVGTNGEKTIVRLEEKLWSTFKLKYKANDSVIALGDYTVISPEYSDIDISPEMFQNIATPKIIYTYTKNYYTVRGAAFKTHSLGYKQYFALAQKIATKPFFRGPAFSAGDQYIDERSSGQGTSGSPGSWIKNSVNSHVSFVSYEISSVL